MFSSPTKVSRDRHTEKFNIFFQIFLSFGNILYANYEQVLEITEKSFVLYFCYNYNEYYIPKLLNSINVIIMYLYKFDVKKCTTSFMCKKILCFQVCLFVLTIFNLGV